MADDDARGEEKENEMKFTTKSPVRSGIGGIPKGTNYLLWNDWIET